MPSQPLPDWESWTTTKAASKGTYNPNSFLHSPGDPGSVQLCSLCGQTRAWDWFSRQTGFFRCTVCTSNLRAGAPITPSGIQWNNLKALSTQDVLEYLTPSAAVAG